MGLLTILPLWAFESGAKEDRSPFSSSPWGEETIAVETDLWQLNQKIAVMEQQRGLAALRFFTKILSDKLIFRRANGKVIGKADFLNTLASPSPFTDYSIEDLEETPRARGEKRALVTLILRTQDQYATVRYFRHIRLFTRTKTGWKLEFWYSYEDLCA